MLKTRTTLLALVAALGLGTAQAWAADALAQSAWKDVGKVVAFADVHGAYDDLVGVLKASKVVDADLRWAAGRAHAVSLGDLLDRGSDSRKVMDLLMRLQDEAARAGGSLHVVLGNHEAMNLLGDLRYVSADEYSAFAQDEPAGAREQARQAWIALAGPDSGPAFDSKFPAGYFGHRAAFAPDGRYGRWLLALPVAIVMNDTLFMHAGPSAVARGMSVSDLNTRYRSALVEYLAALADVEDAGLVQAGDAYAQRADLASQRLAALAVQDNAQQMKLAAAVQRFRAAADSPMLSVDGPNWYRGPALCNECAEADTLLPILDALGLKRLVVGHTPARNGRVAARFDGRVVKLDAGMNRRAYRGHPAALVLEGSQASVIYSDGDGSAASVPPEGLYVAPYEIDDATVADVLENGAVTAAGAGETVVEKNGIKIPAVFVVAGKDEIRRELAAYRLDRALQLGIVPATAARESGGQKGYVQARPLKWVTQADVQKQSLRGGGWCPLDPQFELVYSFDSLVANEGRTAQTVLYDSQEWRVVVAGFANAFGTTKAFPAYLKTRPARTGAELRRRLSSLDEAALQRAVGDLLSARERKAILDRRDLLLAAPPAAAAGR